MPDGSPIDQWWKSHLPAQATTTAADRVCFMALGGRRAYCGRKPKVAFDDWSKVTCSECRTAGRADGLTTETKDEPR